MSEALIHPTAFVDPSARIANDVTVGPFCHIGKNVVLEAGCSVAAHALLNDNVTCKAGVKIFSHVQIGNHAAAITIGEATHVREFALIGTEEESDGPVSIANNGFIMAYCRIGNGVSIAENTILTNAVTLESDVVLEERVIVGGLSTVEHGCRIGTGVMVGGASYVTHDMPPFTLVEGNHAEVHGLNLIGLRRRLQVREDIESIKLAYKSIYRKGVDKALARTISEDEAKDAFTRRFAAFIAASESL